VFFSVPGRVVLVAFLLITLTLGVVAYLTLMKGPTQQQRRGEELAKITLSIQTDYTIPVSGAGAKLSVTCVDTVPNPDKNAQCGQYVEVLRTHTPLLANDIQALQDLRAQIAGSTPLPNNPLDALLSYLKLIHQSDIGIIQAWDSRNVTQWSQAWASRKALPTPNFGTPTPSPS